MNLLLILLLHSQILKAIPLIYVEPLEEVTSWEYWLQHFSKEYESADVHEERRLVYLQNVDKILNHNRQNLSYRMGVNEFSDLTEQEFKDNIIGHGTFSPNLLLENVVKQKNIALEEIDWRKKGAVTNVKNQRQCGSCWAFSSTGALEGRWKIAHSELVSFSEQQLLDCSTQNYGCRGGLMDFAFDYIQKNGGLNTEENYRYTGDKGECDLELERRSQFGNVKTYHDVKPNSVRELEKAVSLGPVSIAIEADQNSFQHYKSGIFKGPCGINLDHGVLLVGYTRKTWIVKNSWGPTWGDQGFIHISKNSTQEGGLCGVLMTPSYPVVGEYSPISSTPQIGEHYENPFNKTCSNEEMKASIQGIQGEICLPQCDSSQNCPAAPSGVRANPMCLLKDLTGTMYCGLECNILENDQCNASINLKCQKITSSIGICTYVNTVHQIQRKVSTK